MTDSTLNRFLSSGTAAERAAFTPSPPTPASGPDPTYVWLETDTGDTYAWDFGGAAWVQVNSGGGGFTAASTTEILTGTDTTKGGTPDSIAALWEQGSDVASAATISLGEGGYFNITGTTTITDIDFATDKAGRKAWLKFAGALTLTNGAALILPTGANITTAAGDTACFVSEGTDVVRCVSYQRASGAAVAGGTNPALVFLAEISASASATIDFTGFISATYEQYVFDLIEIVPATDNVDILMRMSTDGGSTYAAGASDYAYAYNHSTNTFSAGVGSNGTTSIVIINGIDNASNNGATATVRLFNPGGSSHKNILFQAANIKNDNNFYGAMGGGRYKSTTAVNAIRFLASSGNITSGKFRVYGITKA